MLRPAVVSGSFYSGRPDTLVKDIRKYLSRAALPADLPPGGGEPFAVIVPHAGYEYSGQTAAFAYRLLKETAPDRIVMLGPSHHTWVDGNSVYPDGEFETPLGRVPVDVEFAAFLLSKPGMTSSRESHFPEHCLEVQLPFLQVVLKKFSIVPVLIGENSLPNLERLAANLLEAFDKFRTGRTLLLVSTDLSHYHSAEAADRMDGRFIELFAGFKIKELIRELNGNKIEACGAGPVITLMLLAKTLGRTRVRILDYADSSRSSGDARRVVGYFSAAVY
jgi:AmmeMemoRadiSam system protein B